MNSLETLCGAILEEVVCFGSGNETVEKITRTKSIKPVELKLATTLFTKRQVQHPNKNVKP